MEDALDAMIAKNVGLIRSIPRQYYQEVQGIVMRNYAASRDTRTMAKEIRSRYAVTSRRAILIARDQSNKCTSIIERVRMREIGIKEAIWIHSHGGRTPRPTHLAMDHKRYRIEKGMWDSAVKKWIYPGELINCRCVTRAVLPFTPAHPVKYAEAKMNPHTDRYGRTRTAP
jgi:SPP1 gp7 family putative phage head morphogenesis protein